MLFHSNIKLPVYRLHVINPMHYTAVYQHPIKNQYARSPTMSSE